MNEQPQKYLLMPANPTPNGRLHLGHLSGPYFRIDVYGRFLKTAGHDVKTFFGTDAFDSYVQSKANEQLVEPEELANTNYRLICADLDALQIDYDLFVNLVDEEYKNRYTAVNTQMLDKLDAQGFLVEEEELSPFSISENRFIEGAELQGKCPNCFASIGGTCCETCGVHMAPSAVLYPKNKWGEALTEKPLKKLFLKTAAPVFSSFSLNEFDQSDDMKTIINDCLIHRFQHFRLSKMGDYGIKWKEKTLANDAQLMPYAIFLGAIYGDKYDRVNPILANSDVNVVTAFGIDNITPHFINKQLLSHALPEYKPGDQFIINHFLNLEGEKFSTSRGHAIWGAEIIHSGGVKSDGVRYFLARCNTSQRGQDFEIDAFVSFYNNHFVREILDEIRGLLNKGCATDIYNEESTYTNFYERAKEYLAPQKFNTDAYCDLIQEALYHNTLLTGDKLRLFALLSYPIMPELAEKVWKAIGFSGIPIWNQKLTPSNTFNELDYSVSLTSLEAIEACLPNKPKTQEI